METTATQTGGESLSNETEVPGGFTIDTKEKADWFLRKLSEFDAEEAKLKAQGAALMAQLDAMVARNKTDRDAFNGRFCQQFEHFVREQIAQDKKGRRSVLFFHGTAQLRTVPPRLVVESAQDAMTTARAVCPDAVKLETREKFDSTAFLAYATQQFETTGEILPGLRRTEERESFTVKVASAGKQEGGPKEAD